MLQCIGGKIGGSPDSISRCYTCFIAGYSRQLYCHRHPRRFSSLPPDKKSILACLIIISGYSRQLYCHRDPHRFSSLPPDKKSILPCLIIMTSSVMYLINSVKNKNICLRPYHAEYTGSRPTPEVKQRRARSVLGLETAWEYRVL